LPGLRPVRRDLSGGGSTDFRQDDDSGRGIGHSKAGCPVLSKLRRRRYRFRRGGHRPAGFALDLGGLEINLMPYHQFGVKKYESLGMDYKLAGAEPYAEGEVEAIVDLIKSYGLTVKLS
jgi:hypothetical protein